MEDALSRTRADHDNVKVHRSIIADLIKGEMTAEGNTAFSEKLARIYKMTTSGAPLSAVEKNLEVFLASIDKTVLNRETSTNPEEIQTKPEEIQTKPEKIQTDKLNGADKLLVGSAATDASKKRPKKTFTKQMLRRIEAEIKRQEMEIAAAKEAKQAFVNQITMATMEAELSTNGNPNSAFEFLRYLLRRTQGQFRVTDPAVAYRLLHLLAKKGDLEVLRPVLHLMHMEHLPVSAQVLAAKLEALGRGNGPKDEIVEVLNELTSLGLSATNLFTDCCYQRDEHLYVLKAVQRVFPDFKPPRKYVSLGYEDNLLQPLKTASFVPHSMLPPDITLDVLRNLTDEQVDFEKQIMTMIPTICSRSMSQVSGRAYGEEEIPDAVKL
ncbi:unnamed protein product [Cyprideis torosa]|uniref:Uncharacterized protein n=1 Tax=Cyprideis torosa TaxID=163714 RepID=A0A7R8WQ40_9CRUS|nr:unnamed protein product [Cyprideis torosa]CAG0906338.1 unnamed protein product [Cyprideis torosa]